MGGGGRNVYKYTEVKEITIYTNCGISCIHVTNVHKDSV